MKSVKLISYPQYKELIKSINKKIGWDLQLNAIGVSTSEFDESLNPLFSSEEEVDSSRVFKMSDAMALKGMTKKG